MAEPRPDRQRFVLGAWLAILVGLGVLLFVPDTTATMQQAARSVVDRELDELAVLAGLRDARGTILVERPLGVSVVQEGGPLWLTEVTRDVVEADPGFELEDGPHLLRAEALSTEHTFALRLHLYRQGWNLSGERAARIHIAPWAVAGSLVLGALGVQLARRGVGVAWLLAGVMAQAVSSVLPWPSTLPAQTYAEALRDGPLLQTVVRLARNLPDEAVAVGAGIVVLCLVLMAFDHRRSRGRGGWLLLAALAGVVGVVLLLEAAGRTAFFSWLATAPGFFGVGLLIAAWLLAFGARWRRGDRG